MEHLLEIERRHARKKPKKLRRNARKNWSANWPRANEHNGEAESAKKRGIWGDYIGGPEPDEETETGIAPEKISGLLRKLAEIPDRFQFASEIAADR